MPGHSKHVDFRAGAGPNLPQRVPQQSLAAFNNQPRKSGLCLVRCPAPKINRAVHTGSKQTGQKKGLDSRTWLPTAHTHLALKVALCLLQHAFWAHNMLRPWPARAMSIPMASPASVVVLSASAADAGGPAGTQLSQSKNSTYTSRQSTTKFPHSASPNQWSTMGQRQPQNPQPPRVDSMSHFGAACGPVRPVLGIRFLRLVDFFQQVPGYMPATAQEMLLNVFLGHRDVQQQPP